MSLTWLDAKKMIISQILQNVSLDPKSKYKRKVVLTPPYNSRSKIFKGMESYNVQIGKNKFIDIPVRMLELVYEETLKNNGDYSHHIFRKLYPMLAKNSPCYVHTIGQIYRAAGLALRSSYSQYWIKDYLL